MASTKTLPPPTPLTRENAPQLPVSGLSWLYPHYTANKTASLLDAAISVAYWVLTSIGEDAREPEVYRMRKLLEEIAGAVYRATWASIDARPIYRSDADSYLRLADDFAAWAKEQDAVAIPDPED